MAELSSGPFLTLGYSLGLALMMMAFTMVLPSVIVFPGAECGRYWGGGYLLLLGSLVMFGLTRDSPLISVRILVFAGAVAAYLLLGAGDQRFRLKRTCHWPWIVATPGFATLGVATHTQALVVAAQVAG